MKIFYGLGAKYGYRAAQEKSKANIEEIEKERKMFAEQYERYLEISSDQANIIKELEQLLLEPRCCGNCENENWWYGEQNCSFTGKCKVTSTKAVESHWKPRSK